MKVLAFEGGCLHVADRGCFPDMEGPTGVATAAIGVCCHVRGGYVHTRAVGCPCDEDSYL